MEVTVVVPTRNRSSLLTETLRSVLRQQAVNLEVIVVDDASTDSTPAAVAALGDARIRLIRHETPAGVSTARNHGAEEARGDWLAFLDDDDLWAPDKLAKQIAAGRASGRNWVYTGAVVMVAGERGDQIVRVQRPLPPETIGAAVLRYDAIPGGGSTVALRRVTWLNSGGFDTRLQACEDWELWIRLAKHGLPACVHEPLVARRLHSSNSSLRVSDFICGTIQIEALHQTRADWGRLYRWMAHSALRAGRPRTALALFGKAAARGELRAVSADLLSAMKERFGYSRSGSARLDQDDPWIASATEWLQDFRDSLRPTNDQAQETDRHRSGG
jgi:glycosyltransferase involved in cell wall biosynthesis